MEIMMEYLVKANIADVGEVLNTKESLLSAPYIATLDSTSGLCPEPYSSPEGQGERYFYFQQVGKGLVNFLALKV